MPLLTPPIVFTALAALRPFTHSVSTSNPSTPRYSGLAATYNFTLAGDTSGITLALTTSGIDTEKGFLSIPAESGNRAFDVFYYLLTSASTPAEREFLGLKQASNYALLNRSGTYDPPSYLPASDDAASAEDFRAALKAIGIKGAAFRSFLSVLAGLLKLGDTLGFLVDAEVLEDVCEDVGGLLGLEPDVLLRSCDTTERSVFIGGLYEALVDWVILKANGAIAKEFQKMRDGDFSSESGAGVPTPQTSNDNADTVSLTVIEIPGQDVGKAAALRGVFDDSNGINAEMKEDGVPVTGAGSSVIKEMKIAVAEVEADLGISGGPVSRDRERERDRRQGVLEKVVVEAEEGGFLKQLLLPVEGEGVKLGTAGRLDLADTLGSSRVWYHLSIHPTDEPPSSLTSTTSSWSAGTVSRQLRAWRLPEWANRRNKSLDFTADFDVDEFCSRYSRLGCKEGKDGVEFWILERGWSNGEVVVGHERIWMRESAWWEAESMLDLKPLQELPLGNRSMSMMGSQLGPDPFATGYSDTAPGAANGSGFFPPMGDSINGSRDDLLQRQQSSATMGQMAMNGARSIAPTMARTVHTLAGGDYGLGRKGDDKHGDVTYYDDDIGQFTGELDPEFGDPKHVIAKPITMTRRVWVGLTWALTWWIPSFVLRYIGRMKRPDVRMAWREKITLMMLILLLNGVVVFYIIEFGRLLCPNFDKAWDQKEVGYHQGTNDFYVSIHGKVYDITKFAKIEHGTTTMQATQQNMLPFAGQNMDNYFPPPLWLACPGLHVNTTVNLQDNNTVTYPEGVHSSGPINQADPGNPLHDWNWYSQRFIPKIQEYYKGDLVVDKGKVYSQGQNEGHEWVIINDKIYDLTNYFYTLKLMDNYPTYEFFPSQVSDLIKNNPGSDVTNQWGKGGSWDASLQCMENAFYAGKVDFRNSARCQVNNYILLAFTIMLCAVILTKFLSALQLGSKRRPAPQDKFVICQVPAYTEGEDHLRKGLDSLTALQYDNKRKLICVICDGMIVGGGNDRPTPKIVLDILGVDPKIDPPALPFKSVGAGSEQLNYGKVYSGLYEFEGNVVPYLVVVKVGKESEQTKSKPGNRGKRDSQILLMSFLNRVHHRAPMSPLELEMFHQINNIIGVDPELYEYMFMVDADTTVREDALNRLVAACAQDAKIAGICGETSLENEGRSWWTMIQVYEYYISHHLSKAFESLFGSVTCLPGW